MTAAVVGQATVLYVCPCCGVAVSDPPTMPAAAIPPVPMQKG
jgi:hypothetical protein